MSSSLYYSARELAEVLERAESEVRRMTTGSTMSESTTRGFPFMKLPPELRDKIYRYHLILPRPIKPTCPSNTSFVTQHRNNCPLGKHDWTPYHARLPVVKRDSLKCVDPFTGVGQYLHPPESVLSILLINRQIKTEATHIFYRFNNFVFLNVRSLHFFLAEIGTRYIYLGELSFAFCSIHARDVFLKLQNCPFLTKLHIDLRFNGPSVKLNKGGTLKSARGMGELRELRGIEVLDLVGQDRVRSRDGTWKEIDINDDAAVGPKLRRDLMTPRPPEED